MSRRRAILLLGVVALAVIVGAPMVGPKSISLQSIVRPAPGDPGSTIFWDIRLPRVCLAFLAGAGLAVCGMVFQALFRNPLATPFTLGVSSGASLGAAVSVRLGLAAGILGFTGVTLSAFAGALAAICLVYGLTQMRKGFSMSTMLLAGVAVNFFFASMILLVQYTGDYHDTFRILRWLMGGLQMAGFDAPLQVLPLVLLGTGLAALLRNELNLATTGEELAISRGVALRRVKTVFFFAMSIVVGSIVAVCGPIGFVGLMCPHICRLLVGPNHCWLLPATFLFGGSFLVVCDTVARTVLAPSDLPVGIFTAFLGGPFFLWLLLRGSSEKSVI